MTAGERLNHFRNANDLSFADLARRLGCSLSMAWKLCAGQRKPSLQLAAVIERETSRNSPIRAADWAVDSPLGGVVDTATSESLKDS